jgi:hypothetical protein
MDKTSRKFVSHVRTHLREYGYRLILGKGRQLNCGMGRCRGYFDEESREIRVARGSSEWIAILVHEYCHFLQWLDGTKRTAECNNNANWIVCDWLEGRDYDSRTLTRAFARVRWVERDCEKRSVELIKKFGLKIDPILYTRKANLDLYYWHMVERRRKWSWSKRDPFSSHSVMRVMPSSFHFKADQTIPKHIEAILDRF